jgi:hypothetical protein
MGPGKDSNVAQTAVDECNGDFSPTNSSAGMVLGNGGVDVRKAAARLYWGDAGHSHRPYTLT